MKDNNKDHRNARDFAEIFSAKFLESCQNHSNPTFNHIRITFDSDVDITYEAQDQANITLNGIKTFEIHIPRLIK